MHYYKKIKKNTENKIGQSLSSDGEDEFYKSVKR